jgi:uncharacterized membrane protein
MVGQRRKAQGKRADVSVSFGFLTPIRATAWWYVVVSAVVSFVVAPVSLERKSHFVLGGLCAQRPSHSFVFDGTHLPFDARMTGIYLGSFTTMTALFALGRAHDAGRVSVRSWALIVTFVVVMAMDGVNSLLVDLGRWHPYTPDNRLRLATGLLLGVGLGILLVFLLASSVWMKEARRPRPLVREAEIIGIVMVAMLVGLLVLVGGDWLLVPLTLLLLGAAIATVSALAFACLSIIQSPLGLASTWSDLAVHIPRAAGLGMIAMLVLAALRFMAEQRLGPLDMT